MASNARAARARADALARAKEGLTDAAAMELSATIDALWPPGTDLTDEIADEICDLVEAYVSDAASYAADYFLEETGQQSELTPADVYDREWTQRAVRTAAAELGDSRDALKDRLVDHVMRMINRASGDYVIRSARRPVRFARVPAGGETCSFCLMLASRGFVYWSRETAGEFDHYHANCKCVVVASSERHPALEGYDPDGLYDRYRQCRDAAQGNGHGAVDTRAILREMDRRDPDWLRTGKPSPIDDSALSSKYRGRLRKTGEWTTYERLADIGIPTQPQQEDKSAPANIDCKIRGSLWEVKGFTGNAGALWKQLGEAISKWQRLWDDGQMLTSAPRVIVDLSGSSLSMERARGKVSEAFAHFAPMGLEEMFVLMPDGSQLRFKR